MYKYKKYGNVEIEESWDLTTDDRNEIVSTLAESVCIPTLKKFDGVWTQQEARTILESGYRVFSNIKEK